MMSDAVRRVGAVLLWVAAAGALVGAAVLARDVGFEVMRQRVEIMVAVVAVLLVVAAVPVGPVAARGSGAALVRAAAGCVIAFEVLGSTQVMRVVPPIAGDGGPRTGDATTVIAVWLVLLGLVLLAVVWVTGGRASVRPGAVGIAAGCGFAAAAVWLGLTALLPGVASSNVPALLVIMATGGVAAHLIERRAAKDGGAGPPRAAVGAAIAAMLTALAVAAAIDGLLPLGHDWVRNSAPPWETGTRLVDPAGMLVVAAGLALIVAVGARTRAKIRT